MKRIAYISLLLAFLTARIAGAADTVKPEEDVKREAAMAAKRQALPAANSNEMAIPLPQLSASPATVQEERIIRETNRPAALSARLVEPPTPAAPEPRNPWWMILAVLAVVAGSFVIKRLLARSRPS